MSKKLSAMAQGLAVRLRFCVANPGKRNRREWALRSGLTIALYVDEQGQRHVLLSRESEPGPSAQEAQTVIEHWPEPVTAGVEWAEGSRGHVRFLVAVWPALAARAGSQASAATAQLELDGQQGAHA